MTRRLRITTKITRGLAAVSDSTLVIIFIIGCVIAYLINARYDKDEVHAAEFDPQIAVPVKETAPRVSTEFCDADIVCTNYLNDVYEDDPNALQLDLPGDDKLSNTDRLGILKGGKQRRKIRPTDIHVNFINDTLAATAVRCYRPKDGSLRYWNGAKELEGKVDPQKQGAGQVQHFESRLPGFEAQLLGEEEKGRYTTAVMEMKTVEDCVMENWLRPAESRFAGDRDRLAALRVRACEDQWDQNSRWGKMPAIIVQLCRSLVRDQAIDMSALVLAMSSEPAIMDSPAYPFSKIFQDGFDIQDVPKGDGSREVVRKAVRRNEYAEVETLLGWFVLPYRGYLKAQWTDQSKRFPERPLRQKGELHHGSAISISQHQEAGLKLFDSVTKAVGESGGQTLLWLAWAGRRFLINRLFLNVGVDLLDGSVRASITPEDPGSDSTFKLDVTLFIPEVEDLADEKGLEKAAMHSMVIQAAPRGEWSSSWLKDALGCCVWSGQDWIAKKFVVQDKQLDLMSDRIRLRRLFIRPGFSNHKIDQSVCGSNNPEPFQTYNDTRTPILMQLGPDTLNGWANDDMAVPAIQAAITELRPAIIRFVNRRQNAWYPLSGAAAAADTFDPFQVACALGLLRAPLQTQNAFIPAAGKVSEPDGALFKQTAEDIAMRTEAGRIVSLGKHKVHLDFGGLLPFLPSQQGRMQADFIWPVLLPRVGTFYVPFMHSGRPANLISDPAPTLIGDLEVQNNTIGWLIDESVNLFPALEKAGDLVKKVTVVIVMPSLDDAHMKTLHREIDSTLINHIREMRQSGTSDPDAIKSHITHVIEVFHRSVRLTTESECQSTVNLPRLFALGYSDDSPRRAQLLLDLSWKQRAEGGLVSPQYSSQPPPTDPTPPPPRMRIKRRPPPSPSPEAQNASEAAADVSSPIGGAGPGKARSRKELEEEVRSRRLAEDEALAIVALNKDGAEWQAIYDAATPQQQAIMLDKGTEWKEGRKKQIEKRYEEELGAVAAERAAIRAQLAEMEADVRNLEQASGHRTDDPVMPVVAIPRPPTPRLPGSFAAAHAREEPKLSSDDKRAAAIRAVQVAHAKKKEAAARAEEREVANERKKESLEVPGEFPRYITSAEVSENIKAWIAKISNDNGSYTERDSSVLEWWANDDHAAETLEWLQVELGTDQWEDFARLAGNWGHNDRTGLRTLREARRSYREYCQRHDARQATQDDADRRERAAAAKNNGDAREQDIIDGEDRQALRGAARAADALLSRQSDGREDLFQLPVPAKEKIKRKPLPKADLQEIASTSPREAQDRTLVMDHEYQQEDSHQARRREKKPELRRRPLAGTESSQNPADYAAPSTFRDNVPDGEGTKKLTRRPVAKKTWPEASETSEREIKKNHAIRSIYEWSNMPTSPTTRSPKEAEIKAFWTDRRMRSDTLDWMLQPSRIDHWDSLFDPSAPPLSHTEMTQMLDRARSHHEEERISMANWHREENKKEDAIKPVRHRHEDAGPERRAGVRRAIMDEESRAESGTRRKENEEKMIDNGKTAGSGREIYHERGDKAGVFLARKSDSRSQSGAPASLQAPAVILLPNPYITSTPRPP